jgi:signal transduction histidine kinase
VPGVGANAIVELPGGDVWVTGWRGAAHVPASSREVSPPPAVPFLSAIEVDGRPIDAGALAGASGAAWRITLGAPGFRDPDRRRFRARLDGAISAPSPIPEFQLFGLSPGRHALVLEASGGGDTWTALPEALVLRVPAAWYQRWEPYVAVAAFVAAAAWAAHRARVRRVVELERQRLRIAMDLHDDLGSGLGSVGLLASLAADVEVEPATARSAAARIAHIAAPLGDALSDIVWSLRPESGSTGALALRLREQAHRLVPGPRPRLELDIDLPEIRLDPAVCRAAHRIAVEALWNAVKHANAAEIQLRFRAEGGQLRLEVRDDGAGLHAPSASGRPSSGLGHRSMRRRAEDIGATLTIGPNGEAGAAVTLTFDTQVRGGPP